MLGQLMSKDDKEVKGSWIRAFLTAFCLQTAEAEDRIDRFLETQCKAEADQAERAQVDQGLN